MPASDFPELPLETPRRWALAGTKGASHPKKSPFEEQSTGDPMAARLELFQAPQTEAADGYSRWKADMAAERAAQAAARRSTELPVTENADGYAAWKAEAEAARRQFEQRWGVPLGKPVRLQLRDEPREREGVLRMDDDPAAKPSSPFGLRLGDHRFAANQIESLVRLE